MNEWSSGKCLISRLAACWLAASGYPTLVLCLQPFKEVGRNTIRKGEKESSIFIDRQGPFKDLTYVSIARRSV